MTDDVDDFLAHFGVKGMKWGVRKGIRPDGSPIQYETAESGARRAAPTGPNLRGNYGVRTGVKGVVEGIKTPKQVASDRAARKAWENQTGHKTSQAKFDWNHKDPLRTDYTRDEIVNARKRIDAAQKEIKGIIKKNGGYRATRNNGIRDKADDARDTQLEKYTGTSVDSVIAKHRTRGEQVLSTVLFGPVGAYLSSNLPSRLAARA